MTDHRDDHHGNGKSTGYSGHRIQQVFDDNIVSHSSRRDNTEIITYLADATSFTGN